MSRIGKLPITIPSGVTVTVKDNVVTVKGKNGEGWHDSEFTLKTTAISKPAPIDDKALISINKPITNVREKAVFKFETKAGAGGIRILYDPTGYSKTVYRDENIIETTEDGNEIWTITALEFAAPGTYEMYAYAMYNGKWQKTQPETSTVKVVDKNSPEAIIYKVELPTEAVKRYEDATIIVETNIQTTKLQLGYSGTTKTLTSANTQVIANEQGTLTWIINKSFTKSGDVDISFMAKSAAGWSPEANYGTITVVK